MLIHIGLVGPFVGPALERGLLIAVDCLVLLSREAVAGADCLAPGLIDCLRFVLRVKTAVLREPWVVFVVEALVVFSGGRLLLWSGLVVLLVLFWLLVLGLLPSSGGLAGVRSAGKT